MANPDKQRGFKPVRMQNGAPYASSNMIYALIDDSAEKAGDDGFAVGHPVVLADEANTQTGALAGFPLATFMTDEHDESDDVVLGVIVGIASGPFNSGVLDAGFGAFDPADLTRTSVTVAEVEADTDGYLLLLAPANDVVFEVQNSAAEALHVGTLADVSIANDEAGVETVGASGYSLYEANIGGDQMVVVGVPERVDNDAELANADMHVVFRLQFGAPGTAGAIGAAPDA